MVEAMCMRLPVVSTDVSGAYDALRPFDSRGAEFFTVCLRNLRAIGYLDALARKYKVRTLANSQNR